MQFRDTWQMVFDGTKTQTRRIARLSDRVLVDMPAAGKLSPLWYGALELAYIMIPYTIKGITRGGRWIWQTGHRYSIQPGRGQHGLGSFLLQSIRCQPLQDITPEDAYAEGIRIVDIGTKGVPLYLGLPENGSRYAGAVDVRQLHITKFMELWTGLWQGTPYDWDSNPIVYPLGIAEVKAK